jgi:hypothetical protein
MYKHVISDIIFTLHWLTQVFNLYHNLIWFVESLKWAFFVVEPFLFYDPGFAYFC